MAAETRTRAEELTKQGRVVIDEQRTKLQDAFEAGKKAVGGHKADSSAASESEAATN